jgi:hypothetical protein
MATGVLIAGSAIKGVGAIKSKKASKSAAKEQRALDEENTRLYQLEVGESVRRTEASNREAEAFGAAAVGASGFGSGSSMDAYLSSVKKTHMEDVEWMKSSGASNVAIQEREAAARQRNSLAMSKAGFTQSIGSAISGTSGAWG